jgi:hypothetical protein
MTSPKSVSAVPSAAVAGDGMVDACGSLGSGRVATPI